jgi:DNA-binding NarL/FixJ family response regulator
LRRQDDRRQPLDRRRTAVAEAAGPPAPSAWRLSRREVEVLRRLAAGADTRDIAAQLRISPATARNHAQSLLRKLGVHSRGEAIALAYRHKLV